MNLRDLHYFVTLAETLHFGRAARACFVSQPTLSTQLKKLEEELGVALIERAPRKVLLTAAGQEILPHAERILSDVDVLRQTAQRSREPDSGSFRLGVFPTLGPYLLPHIMPSLRQRFPKLELLLTEEKSVILIDLLKTGRLDAACLALPIHEDSLCSELLFEEAFYLAMPTHHSLSKQRVLQLDDLSDHKLLLLEDGHCLRDQALDVCRLSGTQERDGFRATSLETLRQMVAAGVGMTLLPSLAVQAPVPISPHIRISGFKSPQPHRSIALVWRRSAGQDEFIGRVADVIKSLPKTLLNTIPKPYQAR